MKKLLLTLAVIGIGTLSRAQESGIDPGSQAQGYLNSKNMSVDHVTGIFHYKVPLYEFNAGGFTLPISLDYAAKGVKADDQPGIVGYNWNLNTGGVVTRTVRGGKPDDSNSTAFKGEADIFTAVFNGRSVSFILVGDAVPTPLEPTHVKIVCTRNSGTITGWQITDEEGNRYEFYEKETTSTSRGNAISANSISPGPFTSSWYLSTITTTNGSVISFEYARDKISQVYSTVTSTKFSYGKELIEYPYDFNRYKFNQAMNEVSRVLSNNIALKSYQHQIDGDILRINSMTGIVGGSWLYDNTMTPDARLEAVANYISKTSTIYGIINDLDASTISSLESIKTSLENIKLECCNPSMTEVIGYLNKAIEAVDEGLKEKKISWKDSRQYSFTHISTPKLERILCDDRVVKFTYGNRDPNLVVLDKVSICDIYNNTVKSIDLLRGQEPVLMDITFNDKNNIPVQSIKLRYYDSRTYNGVNIFGYFTIDSPDSQYHGSRFSFNCSEDAFQNSLRYIALSNDAEIELQYERNSVAPSARPESLDYGSGFWGGMRIKNIRVKDKISGKTDDVSYKYYYAGRYIYPKQSNSATLTYIKGGSSEVFRDYIEFDKIFNDGPDRYVKLGNNGIYYPRVEESFVGKGSVIYDFVMPDTTVSRYNHWNVGDMLGQSFFDKDQRLVKVVRYEYDGQLALYKKKYLDQKKKCEYFYEPWTIPWPTKGNTVADQYYLDNIYSRYNISSPREYYNYQIAYDYDSYLKRVKTYYFDNLPNFYGSEAPYTAQSPHYSITEYDYDLSKSTFPVKTTVTNSDGTKYIETVMRALDFYGYEDESIEYLQEQNIVGPPLKIQKKIVTPDGVEKLLVEQINKYTYSPYRNSSDLTPFQNVQLSGIYEYRPVGSETANYWFLFGFDESKYDKTTINYDFDMTLAKLAPVSISNKQGRQDIVYDYYHNEKILVAYDAPENSVTASDFQRFKIGNQSYPGYGLNRHSAPSQKYKLYVIANPSTSQQLTLSIMTAGVTSTRNFTLSAGKSGPQVFDLDLTAGTGSHYIYLSSSIKDLIYIALVPVDCRFEAVSYNWDGTVYCKFDQSGQLERYEYDGAGRVVKVFDRNGSLLRQKNYNFISQPNPYL